MAGGNQQVDGLPLIPDPTGADVYAPKDNVDYRVRTGQAGGLATLDGTGKLLTAQKPAYTKSEVGLGNVDNTSDLNKPVSTAQQSALNLKANLASPALTGTPTAPTAAVGTNTTQLASTAFVQAEIANDAPTKIGGGASGTWGISITGTAPFSGITGKPTTLAGYGITDAMATSWTLTAGNGLTGGGSGAANRTLALGTPGSLTNSTTNAVTATSHTHDVTLNYLRNTDDRSAPLRQVPADYNDVGLSVAFNNGTNLGMPVSYGMSLHLAPWLVYNGGYKQHQLNFAGDGHAFYWRTATSDTTWGPAYKVHTDASTDIDAATLASLAPSANNDINTIVARNGGGDIVARMFRSEYTPNNPTVGRIMTQVAPGVGTDNYIRASTPTQVATALLAEGQIGYRNVPLTTTNADYTFVADDAGKCRMHTDITARTYTIPAVFAAGDVLTVVNSTSGGLTLVGSGVGLFLAPGTTAAGNRTLGARAVATVFFISATQALVFGVGVS